MKKQLVTAAFYFVLIALSGSALGAARKAAPQINAAVIDVSGDWKIDGDLPREALLISLEGVVNKNGPRLYLLYGKNYPYTNVQSLLDYYRKKHHVTTTRLNTVEEALQKFKDDPKGYVVWDKRVRTSLIVAYTVAGLEDAVVVTGAQIPLVEKIGLKPVADFRGKFTGKSDLEIYQWAYDTYWNRCSREYITFIGGVGRGRMQPAIADFGMIHKTFFTDLSTRLEDRGEYDLASKIFGEMKPFGIVLGWHAYTKDLEEEYVTLASSHALRVEGLNTAPNLSFHSQIPATPGFQFKQKHKYNPNPKVEKKVYITLIQSDGLGIGAWLKPGRGEIPYGWEVIMNWINMAPAMLQFYYEQATPNDCFLGALGGAGYMYPKAIPPDKLPESIRLAGRFMDKLDLRIFEIFDASEPGTRDLPKRILDAFYKNMPDALGFFNGYGPAHTFDDRDGRPFISYDYYLSPKTSEAQAVADLEELATINPKRPYFLAFHVRESNDVKRVKAIMDALGPDFEIVAPDEFLTMAGERPTFTTRYEQPARADFSGVWKLDKRLSANIGIYKNSSFGLVKRIAQKGSQFSIETISNYGRSIRDSFLEIKAGGAPVKAPDRIRRMGYMGAYADSILTRLTWGNHKNALIFNSVLNLETSQGTYPVKIKSVYHFSRDGRQLIMTETRSSQKDGKPSVFVFLKTMPVFK
ncbi:hypothetical protein BMS3Abin05_01500 [bacterium BMS3Abin05]|nr:hypothetical protein BMS3Abin05_01500 [bacterium BMS3Abin05]GBE27066.1 hypothetical protein BMS3Bbin03_00986 [bacterium BMS3Bbin03]